MQDEELFVGKYILRRVTEDVFELENTVTGAALTLSENKITNMLNQLWKERAE